MARTTLSKTGRLTLAVLLLLIVVILESGSFSDTSGPSSRLKAALRSSRQHATLIRPKAGRSLSTLELVSNALVRLERTPIATYDDALRANTLVCKGREAQSNRDQINGESSFWRGLTSEYLVEKRSNIIEGVRDAFGLPGLLEQKKEGGKELDILQTSPMFGDGRRGIVYTGGNADTLERVYNSMRVLRYRAHSDLPVEIFSFPQEMTLNPGEGIRGEIEQLGNVVFKQLLSSAKLPSWKNFQIKGEAIVKSSFSEVLYLDSDNIVLADPAFLFESPVYKVHRAVFWPDITRDGPANPVWRTFGLQCRRNEWQLDSGQILIDKRGQNGMNLAALIAAARMQEDHAFWFKISGGDKDTFRYGFYALGIDYTPAPHALTAYGNMHNYETEGHTFCGLVMLQHSLSPADWQHYPSAKPSAALLAAHAPPLFVHANLLKHSSGYQRGKFLTHVKYAAEDRTDRPSDRARSVVYTSRQGMCVDLWDAFDDIDPRIEGNREGNYENGQIRIESSPRAFGGVLDGFEEMFWHERGKGGGF